MRSAPQGPYATLTPAALAVTSTRGWHLARRVAHAPTAALAASIDRTGPLNWMNTQLAPGTIDDSACTATMTRCFPWEFSTALATHRATGQNGWKSAVHLTASIAAWQVLNRRHLLESMVEFYSDQIFVRAEGKAMAFVNEYNWKVLRRHALGRFADLLHAALRHPALLIYLDNETSTKVRPNENLARELLELHTVGVGAFREADVANTARLLTGHSLSWETMSYRYNSSDHYVGPVKVLGFSHANGTAAGGPAVLQAFATYLARHPATARRLAHRLAVRFVSDSPSTALVDRLTSIYLANDTNIRPVLRALFADREFLDSVGQKMRRPAEAIGAMMAYCGPGRITLTDSWVKNPYRNISSYCDYLQVAGHEPRMWPAVDGYPDVAGAWTSTATLRALWYASEALSGRWDGVQWPITTPPGWGAKVGDNVWELARAWTYRATGYRWDQQSLAEIARWLCASYDVDPAPDRRMTENDVKWNTQQATRMVLASPYMLMR